MTELVPKKDIERIVGVQRDPMLHYARAVSTEQTVYILHSRACLESGRDLRECPASLALDWGIDERAWAGYEDRPVRVLVADGQLIPHQEHSS